MSEDIVQGVIETIDTANRHRLQLAELSQCLQDAKSQVQGSAHLSKEKLKENFSQIKLAINKVLDNRLQYLIGQIDEIEKESVEPLKECEDIVNQGVNDAKDILKEGKNLLGGNHEANTNSLVEFKKKADRLDRIPEVPHLSEVPCIFVDLPDQIEKEVIKNLSDYGRVISRAPVQISEIQERPGGLMIKWMEVEEESMLDLCEFRLQYCCGMANNDESKANEYQDVYEGSSLFYTMRNLKPMTNYSFRVSGRAEGVEVWSPWSIPCSAITTLPHYEWFTSTQGYTFGNENKIASREEGEEIKRVLYSDSNSYTCGHSIIFKILEAGKMNSSDGIGLAVTKEESGTLLRPGALFVNSDGIVFIDGQEKLTKLPPLTRTSVVTFETEVLQSDKVRVTIEVNDKIVTFDWVIQGHGQNEKPTAGGLGFGMGNTEANNKISMYFGAVFTWKEWKVCVQ